jgi:hypothetical protein
MKIIIAIASYLAISGFLSSNESSNYNFSYDDIKKIQKGSLFYIIEDCNNQKKCVEDLYYRFRDSFKLSDIEHGHMLFSRCYKKYIDNKKSIDIKSYIKCTENYRKKLEMETVDKSINHLLIDRDKTDYMVSYLCRSEYSLRSERINKCLKIQNKNSRLFLRVFFSEYNESEKINNNKFKKCIEESKKINNLNFIYFDFRRIMSCLKQ